MTVDDKVCNATINHFCTLAGYECLSRFCCVSSLGVLCPPEGQPRLCQGDNIYPLWRVSWPSSPFDISAYRPNVPPKFLTL